MSQIQKKGRRSKEEIQNHQKKIINTLQKINQNCEQQSKIFDISSQNLLTFLKQIQIFQLYDIVCMQINKNNLTFIQKRENFEISVIINSNFFETFFCLPEYEGEQYFFYVHQLTNFLKLNKQQLFQLKIFKECESELIVTIFYDENQYSQIKIQFDSGEVKNEKFNIDLSNFIKSDKFVICQKLFQNIYKLSNQNDYFKINIQTQKDNFGFMIQNQNTNNFSKAGNIQVDNDKSNDKNNQDCFELNFSVEQLYLLYNIFQQFDNINFCLRQDKKSILFSQQRFFIQINCELFNQNFSQKQISKIQQQIQHQQQQQKQQNKKKKNKQLQFQTAKNTE